MATKSVKTKGKPKTRRPKGKNKAEFEKEELDTTSSRTAARTKENDPSWYANSPELLRDAASLPFSQALGLPFSFNSGVQGALPGVVGLGITLVPGQSDFADSPINIAARNIYSWVRHANSGHANYDSPNLMMYIMAMDSLYATYAHCARMYGLIRTYAQKNRYYPRAFFDIVGWDYDDFVANQAKFRLWLNTFVEKVGSMCVPANMTFTLRHMWMFQNVWLDGMTSKSQSYFYFPTHCFRYRYDKNNAQYPIQLTGTSIQIIAERTAGTTLMTVDALIARVDACIQSIMRSEDLAIMSGDILKAYGREGIWRLMPIHEDLVVLPSYSQEVLYQIHNSMPVQMLDSFNDVGDPCWIAEYADSSSNTTWLKTLCQTSFMDDGRRSLYSNYVNLVKHFCAYKTPDYNQKGSMLLDFHHEDVTPEDVMVGSRLTPSFLITSPEPSGAVGTIQVFAGSEVVTSMRYAIWKHPDSANIPPKQQFRVIEYGAIAKVPLNRWQATPPVIPFAPFSDEDFAPFMMPSLFELHPHVYALEEDATSGTLPVFKPINYWNLRGPISGIENYTQVSTEVLQNMHLAALMSEFSVPKMGAM